MRSVRGWNLYVKSGIHCMIHRWSSHSGLVVLSLSFLLCWIVLLVFVHRGQDNNVKYLKAKLGYRKIKTQVPRHWLTIPSAASVWGHSHFHTQQEVQKPAAAFVCHESDCILSVDWPPGLSTMSFTFIAMMMLVGSSVVMAFVLQPSKEEPAASANSPVSHHRSVFHLFVWHFAWLCNVVLLFSREFHSCADSMKNLESAKQNDETSC